MEQREHELVVLASGLGLTETGEMSELRPQIIAAGRGGNRELYLKLANRYADIGEGIVSLIPDGTDKYLRAQIAMNILRLRLSYVCGGMDDHTEGWYDDIWSQLPVGMQATWQEIEKIFS